MKIGYPTGPRNEAVAEIEWAGREGFDFIDLFLEPDKGAIEHIDPVAIRETLDRFKLDVVGHLAWYIPIGSPLPQLRRAAVETIVQYLRGFAGIGVPAVTVHANWPSRMFSIEEGIRWQIESLRTIMELAKNLGVGIMYEPIDKEEDMPENIEKILAGVPGLMLHLDIGHSNLHGRRPVPIVEQFAGRIQHVHVSDNDGTSDQHRPIGIGNIGWEKVFGALKAAGYDRTVTLEIFDGDRTDMLKSREEIRRLLRAD